MFTIKEAYSLLIGYQHIHSDPIWRKIWTNGLQPKVANLVGWTTKYSYMGPNKEKNTTKTKKDNLGETKKQTTNK